MNRTNSGKVDCSLLDAYCVGALKPREAVQFYAHSESCVSCRTAVQQQQWIDELLSVSGDVEKSPIAGRRQLIESLNRLERRRRLNRLFGGVAAAAAVLLLASLLLHVDQRPHNELVEASPHPSESTKLEGSNRNSASADSGIVTNTLLSEETGSTGSAMSVIESPPIAEFEGHGDVIAVRAESSSSEVTVFQVFPTTDAQRRHALADVLASVPYHADGGM